MKIKGLDKFLEKIPAYRGKNAYKIPLLIINVIIAELFTWAFFAYLPSWVNAPGALGALLPFSPVIGFVILETIGFLLVWQVWWRRDVLKKRHGKLAYQEIIPVGLPGIAIEIFLQVIAFLPAANFATSGSPPVYRMLLTPVTDLLPEPFPGIFLVVRIVAGAFLLLTALGIVVRAFFTFGLDYMAVVYLYFPEESEIQDRKIYSVLRHPAYAGLITLGAGGMCTWLTPYNIIIWVCFLVGMTIHVRLVEERELIQRFGDSYKNYMKSVPAFFVKPSRIPDLYRFILGR